MTKKSELTAIVDKALVDADFRKELVTNSFYWFLHIYFPDYLEHPSADFHKEMIEILQNLRTTFVCSAFRGSGKSTVVTLAYVLWSMLGTKSKKYIVICSNTARQTEILMHSIKNVLELHPLLKNDLGPFSETAEQWNISSLIFTDYDAKIMGISVNESIRGIKHKNRRPDLIILDDVETLDTARNEDNRDKLLTWFDRDITPLGAEKTNMVVIGTIMTAESLIDTLKTRIESGYLNGTFRKYPIITEDDQILWSSRWPDMASIEEFRKNAGIVNRTWETEYLLNDYIKEDQIITQDMIKYYDDLPFNKYTFMRGYLGVDLASSDSPTASKTAIVRGYMFKVSGEPVLYILPNPVNKRITVPETIDKIKQITDSMKDARSTRVFVEDVGYQKAMIQILKNDGYYNTESYKVMGRDKRTRLEITVHYLSQGKILFPRQGAEDLIRQLIRFDFEKYKDLADAYSILVDSAFTETTKSNNVVAIKSIGRGGRIPYDDGPRFSYQFNY
jgi:phage terminase large subunit-like protein